MKFKYWCPPYRTDLDPYAVKGEGRAKRFAENFNCYNDLGFGGFLVQAQILAQAKGTTIPERHLDVFCELTGMKDGSRCFSTMFEVGDRLWELERAHGEEGAMWLMLHSLVLMRDDDFSRMLNLAEKVKHKNADMIIDDIVDSSRD